MRSAARLIIITIGITFFFCSCSIELNGDKDYSIFNRTKIYFNPSEFSDGIKKSSEDSLQIENGRISLKKISIPKYEASVKITARVRIRSNGDRWDKAGSLFIIPSDSKINLINIAEHKFDFPPAVERTGDLIGTTRQKNYKPVIELIRFMTPFGVGFYSGGMEKRRPVYIPKWENEVVWEEDVSNLISYLEGDVWIGIWIDAWTSEGYLADVNLIFDESDVTCAKRKTVSADPLVNTIVYAGGQIYPDLSDQNILTDFTIPESAKNIKLHYITTGHGGHSGGDEFTKQNNIIYIDGEKVFEIVPWRDDCASFRRFNPHSGVWLVKDTVQYIDESKGRYAEKIIEERIASSDLSRSNWCPGSDVPPITIPLGHLTAGIHTLSISIPDAQPLKENEMNHWLISAYLTWEN